MKLTDKDKSFLSLSLELLERHYDEKEELCRKFKWLCHSHLPQAGEEYEKIKNVFEIEEKTISDIRTEKEEAKKVILKLINSK